MDKALVFGTKDCRFESCQDQVFAMFHTLACLDPMMLLLPKASSCPCTPSLAWPHLILRLRLVWLYL